MGHDFLLGGIILSPLVPQLVLALLLTVLVSMTLMRFGFYRLVWHRALVELAIFCIVLGGVVTLIPNVWEYAVSLIHGGLL